MSPVLDGNGQDFAVRFKDGARAVGEMLAALDLFAALTK